MIMRRRSTPVKLAPFNDCKRVIRNTKIRYDKALRDEMLME